MNLGKRIKSNSVPCLEKRLMIFSLSLILKEDTVILLYKLFVIISIFHGF